MDGKSYPMVDERMRECIEECQNCHDICAESVTHCLQMGGDHAEPSHIKLRGIGRMTLGEMRELEAYDALDYSEDAYLRLIHAKTASLLSGASEVGAVDAPVEQRQALRRYGMLLGMAFQITDDVLDYTETARVTGKPSGLDLKEHKITLPLIAALPGMTDAERGRVSTLMKHPEPGDALVSEVMGVVHSRGGVEAARTRAHEYAEQAAAALQDVPAGGARDALADEGNDPHFGARPLKRVIQTQVVDRVAQRMGGLKGEEVDLVAPSTPGDYKGNWKVSDISGNEFGIGRNYSNPFYVSIEVNTADSVIVLNFAASYCSADWESNTAELPCPGEVGDDNGFVVYLANPNLEHMHENEPTIWVQPDSIRMVFSPAFTLNSLLKQVIASGQT